MNQLCALNLLAIDCKQVPKSQNNYVQTSLSVLAPHVGLYFVFRGFALTANPREQVEAWEKRLGVLSETLDEWVAVQRNWMYLETIFCAEDIQKQLPEEAAKFQAVDKMWKVLTRNALFIFSFFLA